MVNKIRGFGTGFRHQEYSFLCLEDCSWDFSIIPLFSQILPASTESFDQQQKCAYKMTMEKYGAEAQDTKYFREAIKLYILQLYGIKSEEYDYNQLNLNLKSSKDDKDFKIYMR
jgi:hypothetical protein